MGFRTSSLDGGGKLLLLFWAAVLALVAYCLRSRTPEPWVPVQRGGYFAGRLGPTNLVYLWLSGSTGEINARITLAPGETFGIPQPTVDSNGVFVLPVVHWGRGGDDSETNLTLAGSIQMRPPAFSGYWTNAATSQAGPFELPRIARTCWHERQSSFNLEGTTRSFVGTLPFFDSPSRFHEQCFKKLRRRVEAQAGEFVTLRWHEVRDRIRACWGNWRELVALLRRQSEFSRPYTAECRASLEFYSENLVSVLLDQLSDTGGVHPNTYLNSANYVRSGNRVVEFGLKDLFRTGSGWEQRLVELVLEDLRDQGATAVTGGYADLHVEDLLFTVRREGICFWFEPYLVGCYAEGTYCALVPWKALREHLRPDCPARLLSTK